MRSTKLRPAFAAAAALLALAPAGAAAAKHAGPTGCHVSIYAEPHVVTSGEAVQVFGALSCPGGASTANQAVTVYERTAGRPGFNGFKVIGTATTGAGGVYSITPPAVTTASLFYVRAGGARSGNRAVKVAPVVTLGGPPDFSQLRTGVRNRVTFTGTVTPADAGAVIVLQRENATSFEEWIPIQLGVVGPGGSFSLTHTFVVPGAAELRVVVRAHGKFNMRGVSNTLSYEISQAQNPRLTINASADPISYGQSVTLSGILAGGANQKVTLMGHTQGQPGTKLAETTTNGSGEYTLVEKPLVNTSYRVTAGSIGSAVLFEGVKYVLTAGASATTVQAGHPVTFSGTVTPGHIGHIVYLERENAFGGGYHVVDIGVVSASSTYTINHFVFGSGKQVFRVKVPGDPENQGVSSSLFPTEVTPAPPGSLRPEPPSKLPSEGKI
jgi:hypothetical protein